MQQTSVAEGDTRHARLLLVWAPISQAAVPAKAYAALGAECDSLTMAI